MIIIIHKGYILYVPSLLFELLIIQNKNVCPKDFELTRFDIIHNYHQQYSVWPDQNDILRALHRNPCVNQHNPWSI